MLLNDKVPARLNDCVVELLRHRDVEYVTVTGTLTVVDVLRIDDLLVLVV